MTSLQAYFFKQTWQPLLVTASIMAVLALLTQSLSSIDLIIDNRASFFAVLKITVLALPQVFSIVLPFAVFIAIAHGIQRLHADNEIMVVYASGMTKLAVISPVLRTVSYVVLLNLLINLFLQPVAFRSMRETIYAVRSDLAATIIRPGEFVSPVKNLTIFSKDLKNGVMSDIFIHDARDPHKPVTLFAATGVFTSISDNPSITLNDVSRQSLSVDGTLEFLEFSSTSFELGGVIGPQGDLLYKFSDRYISELFNPIPFDAWEMANKEKMLAEAHYRLASPIYNYAFALLALAALLGGQFSKMGYGRRLIAIGVIALLIRLVGFTITSAAAPSPSLNYLQYFLPVFVSFICLWILLVPKKINPEQLKANK